MRYPIGRTYIILTITVALMIFFSSGCSYVMDYIEGRLTDRASFSIEATYDSVAKEVTIEWDERGSGDDFAGYEIYITEDPDDEYVGYELAVSYYEEPNSNISTAPPSSQDDLKEKLTGIYILDVSLLVTNAPGIYFFRVGIINWDESDEEDRIDDYIGGTSWNIEPHRRDNYYSYSGIIEISGYAMVEIE